MSNRHVMQLALHSHGPNKLITWVILKTRRKKMTYHNRYVVRALTPQLLLN